MFFQFHYFGISATTTSTRDEDNIDKVVFVGVKYLKEKQQVITRTLLKKKQ